MTCFEIQFFGKVSAARPNKLYNGEFDPGSGLTLAAGLIHASCTGLLVAILIWE